MTDHTPTVEELYWVIEPNPYASCFDNCVIRIGSNPNAAAKQALKTAQDALEKLWDESCGEKDVDFTVRMYQEMLDPEDIGDPNDV